MFNIYLVIDIISIVIIYIFIFYQEWKSDRYILITKTLLFYYFAFVLFFTNIIPIIIPIPLINTTFSNVSINLVPFLGIINGYKGATREILLNILMFIPFGILYPLSNRCKFSQVVIKTLLVSLAIELWQFLSISGFSVSDITDIITNFVGSMIGYFIYRLCLSDNYYSGLSKNLFLSDNTYKMRILNLQLKVKSLLILIIFQLIVRSLIFSFI